MLNSFAILCCGDHGGVIAAQEIPVVVREVDRRVLLVDVGTEVGLITCVLSRIGQAASHSTPVSRGAGVLSGPLVTENKQEMERQEGNEQKEIR